MFIADAQVHVWGPNTPARPWRVGHKPSRAAPLEAEDLLREMRAAGVARAVLVPPYVDCERNDLVLAAAQRRKKPACRSWRWCRIRCCT